MLSGSLIKRMRLDLTTLHDEDDVGILHEGKGHDESPDSTATASRRWIAHPKTLRLSTRPRPALNPDGTRPRTFARMSKSSSMPTFVFSFTHTVDFLAERLVEEALLPLFWKLHQEKSGWDLSLVNVCATNMSMTASESGMGAGRDIGKMFRRQEDVLKDWKISDLNIELPDNDNEPENDRTEQADSRSTEHQLTDHQSPKNPFLGSEDLHPLIREVSQGDDAWNSEDDLVDLGDKCIQCGAVMPPFAMIAHERFHSLPD